MSRMREGTILTVCLLTLVLISGSAYAVDMVGFDMSDSNLYSINPVTGATAFLAYTNICGAPGACGAGSASAIYVVADGSPNELYSMNVSSGLVTKIGTFTGLPATIRQLAYDAGAGVMYGTDRTNLYRINPLTAATTLVGDFGGIGDMLAMGFVPGQGLYGVSNITHTLYRISTQNGALTTIGLTGADRITDIAYSASSQRLIGVTNSPTYVGGVYQLSLSTGAATLLSTNGRNIMGIAELVPEPSSILIMLCGIGGMIWRRRR